ncbi:hypothetical protein AAFN86_06460 [Roseomonas sp. CAU 1739]|uniref:hypothetical protein n=1 Tax=Roseomonas sp. CAU 1739 TaxID=3140364 RepID=UPI00325C03DF
MAGQKAWRPVAELYLIDERAPMADAWERFIPRTDASVLILRSDAIAAIATGALSRLSEPRFAHAGLRGLTIIAHGNASSMEIGTGCGCSVASWHRATGRRGMALATSPPAGSGPDRCGTSPRAPVTS